MKCTDKKMANRVAVAGALKMGAEGYHFRPWGAGGTVAKTDHSRNFVELPAPGIVAHCTCAFFKENREFGTCKHIVWAGWQAKALVEREEMQDFEDRIALEAETRMSAECPTHGTITDKWRATA